jgi:hypothetical protein
MNFKSLTLVGLLLAGLVSAPPGTQSAEPATAGVSPADKMVQTILNKGYKRVAVLPRVVSRNSSEDNRVSGKNSLGALSVAWPDELYDALIDASLNSNGKFAVVTDQQVLQALKGKKGDDVGTDEMWKVIREKTGADFLASIDVTDPGPIEGRTGAAEVKRVVNGVDLKNNSAAGRVTQNYSKSLSDAAYAGESFVAREWKGNRLEATGLSGSGKLFDVGPMAEKEQYANLNAQEKHPLLLSDFPYRFVIEVNGMPRIPKIIDEQLVVTLDVGEEYIVRVWNQDSRDVFMGLYIDGVNTNGAHLERPDATLTTNCWWLPAGPDSRRIQGWRSVDPVSRQEAIERFVVVGAKDSVAREASQAGGEGFDDSLGMITAIFYTYGMDNISNAKAVQKPAGDEIGTGRGAKQGVGPSEVDPNAKQKGLMLSSATVYYRSTQWFKKNSGEQPSNGAVAEGPAPEKEATEAVKKKLEEDQPIIRKPAPKKSDKENDLPE